MGHSFTCLQDQYKDTSTAGPVSEIPGLSTGWEMERWPSVGVKRSSLKESEASSAAPVYLASAQPSTWFLADSFHRGQNNFNMLKMEVFPIKIKMLFTQHETKTNIKPASFALLPRLHSPDQDLPLGSAGYVYTSGHGQHAGDSPCCFLLLTCSHSSFLLLLEHLSPGHLQYT